jgi:hypothetical protein
MELTGRCYCGDVHYKAEGDAMMKAQCHCRECQYITGGEPNIFIAMPIDGFAYTKGAPKDFTLSPDSSAPIAAPIWQHVRLDSRPSSSRSAPLMTLASSESQTWLSSWSMPSRSTKCRTVLRHLNGCLAKA